MAANDKKNHEDIKNMLVVLNDIYKSSYIFNVHKIQNELLANDIIYVNMRMLIDINNMCLKVKSCIDLYNSISTGYKESNYQLNIKLCNFLFNYLFYIYQYYIIVNDYILYYPTTIRPTKRPKHSTPSVPVQNLNFFQYIDTYIKPTTSYTSIITSLSGYKKFIIYRFNKEIFDDNNSSTELLLLKSYIYLPPSDGGYNLNANIYNANHIISNIDNIKNYIREFKKYIIKDIFILPFDNNYIAIPQFEGICWFISMITALSYSDMNRKLITDKIIFKGITEDVSSTNFINFIQYIINNISEKRLTYNSDTPINISNILTYIQEKPIQVLKDIVIKYGKEVLCITNAVNQEYKDDIKKFIDKLIGLQINNINNTIIRANLNHNDIKNPFGYIIFYNLLKTIDLPLASLQQQSRSKASKSSKSLDTTIITKNIFDRYINGQLDNINFDYFGIYDYQYYILQYLYLLLDIKNVYGKIVVDAGGNKSFHKLLNDNIDPSPEVIILHTSELSRDPMYDASPIANMSLNVSNDIITYNGFEYKLDYLLQASDQSLSCVACGHCISGIVYNNINYIHDSKNIVKRIKINGKYFMKACPLSKHDWTTKILQNLCYSVEKCGVDNVEIASVSKAVQNTANINLCYNANKNYTLVYVKIQPDSALETMVPGGSANKYISIDKKIEFIYKNRKYSRTIYTKNNNKYFLFNKEYHLLSKIKNLKL